MADITLPYNHNFMRADTHVRICKCTCTKPWAWCSLALSLRAKRTVMVVHSLLASYISISPRPTSVAVYGTNLTSCPLPPFLTRALSMRDHRWRTLCTSSLSEWGSGTLRTPLDLPLPPKLLIMLLKCFQLSLRTGNRNPCLIPQGSFIYLWISSPQKPKTLNILIYINMFSITFVCT